MSAGRRKDRIKKSTIIKTVLVLAVIVLAGGIAVKVLRDRVNQRFADSEKEEVLSAQAVTGSISTTVSGSGTLANQESEDTFISGTVEVKEVYVKAGDNVQQGDMLASVESASVVKAMKEVQDKIDAVDKEIDALSDSDIDDTIEAGVEGRVKKIYAHVGENTADVMLENGALALLSVDGYMAVDIETDKLSQGDSVTVVTGSGDEYTGSVESVWAGTVTVLVDDTYTSYGSKVTVKKGGKKVGTGKLYIHEQVAVTGFTGSISSVYAYDNEWVYAGTTLFALDDVSNTVSYASLLEKRADLEEELHNLIIIHKEGAVYAQKNGMVTSISRTEDSKTTTVTAATSGRMAGSSFTTVTEDTESEEGTTISICPTDYMTIKINVDETDILSLQIGQKAEVTVSSLGDDAIEAEIIDIDTVGTSSNGVTTYTASLQIEKKEGMLDGMSASAVITIEGKDNALLVPVDAVHKTSASYYVYTSYDEETKEFGDMVEVTAGISNSNYMEIASGLSEGDTVYYTKGNDDQNNGFGNMPGGSFPGGGFDGGGFPGSGSGSQRPGGSGSGRPSGSGSGFPGGSGSGFPGSGGGR